MPLPSTNGQLRTNINDMQIGDYIICKYVATSGAVGTFSELGTSVAAEIPVIGAAVPNGTFYFIKTAKGLLCADRCVQHTISWDVLNTGRVIQGRPHTFGNITGTMRSLTGGVAYADVNGNLTLARPVTDLGCFPTNNEYDTYIKKTTVGGKSTVDNDDVWHHKGIWSWVQDTTANGFISVGVSATNTHRMVRGYDNYSTVAQRNMTFSTSSSANNMNGFRPVFEYQE